jgi:hypothetical protein
MSLLARASYDPAVAVTKATSSLLAMTALDTTNLRLTFTAPANGIVLVRLKGQALGATTFPRILLGILETATLRGRAAPVGMMPTGVAADLMGQEATYLVTGLTPGNSYTWDAAYGVEIVLASTNLKYGGPNDNSGADAFGAFVFEVWKTDNLLAGTFYDPTTAATLATTSLLAMTAMDTSNLRLTFTAPASGNVMWRIHGQHHGSTTFGQVLLGILESTTVVARQAPTLSNPQTALATACMGLEASGVITGVSAGSHTYDAAYAVQVVAGAGGIKYGGPDNATTNDAFGGLAFELWAA